MLFTLKDLETHLPPENFHKGWQIFTAGKVTAPNVQRGGELITAIIPQATSRPLRVYIRTHRENNGIILLGECSCAVKQNCEHVAAVLLQALDDQQALPDDAAPLASPGTGAGQAAGLQQKPRQTLLYLLQFDDGELQLQTCVARPLTQGGFSGTKPFDTSRANQRTPPQFLQPVDLELMASLNKMPYTPGVGAVWLAGPRSVSLFEAILATGRCYFESAEWGPLLSSGPVRSFEFQWQMDDFGYQLGECCITPDADILLPLAAPWYLDSETGLCGPLDSKLPVELIKELLAMAPVSPEQVVKVNKALGKAWPASTVPPLRSVEVKILPRVKPVPCLHVVTEGGQAEEDPEEEDFDEEEPMWDDWHEPRNYAYLGFAYEDNQGEGIEVELHGPSTRVRDGQLVQVQRDEKAEKVAVKLLHKLGFEEAGDWGFDDGENRFSLESEVRDNDAEAWLDFQVEDAPGLLAQGWRIEYENFCYRLAEPGNWVCHVDRAESQDSFDVGLGIDVEGQRVELLPILLDFLDNFSAGLPDARDITTQHFIIPFEISDADKKHQQRLLHLPAARILPYLETLQEIYGNTAQTDTQKLRLSRVQLAQLTALDQRGDGPRLQWLADDDIQQLARRLRELDGIPEVAPPAGLIATLRPYQQEGLNWLQFLREYQLAGILADDMGLGKTVQALAHLLLEKESGRADRPSLVVAPTSLMFNWRLEAERFAPQLRVLVLHGPQRKQRFHTINDHDLVITTYPLLARDGETLLAHRYHLVILDEAQVIKNPKAQASRAVRDIEARHRLCLTGTPMENHLGELWSLFDFLLPGLLGDSKQFRRIFRSPIEKQGNEATAQRLSQRIRPFLLRRTKDQVATELPPKTEIIQTVVLEGKQRELYETVRLAMHRRVRDEIQRQGLNRSHIIVLDALLKLRQVCCDPRLVKTDKTTGTSSDASAIPGKGIKQSAKLEMLMELLPEMVEEGRRILVFSQFTTMLGLIEDELKQASIDFVKLTGQTRNREKPVQQFQAGDVPVFLISLKAGGTGLNLTAADTVIHYDPWWNPAAERQATDRAHRIGQQQAVFVYKLICEGTLEEKIQVMQQRKQALADGLYQDGSKNEPQWNEQDLEALFGPLGAEN